MSDEFNHHQVIICEGRLWKKISASNQRPVSGSGSWKDHWIKHNQGGHHWPETCQVCDCQREAEFGVLIVLADDDKLKKEYVIPMCKGHSIDMAPHFVNLKQSAFVAPAEVDQ